jgi:hypothetical protein
LIPLMSGSIPKSGAIGTIPVEATKLFDPADERDEIAKANTNQNYI